MRARLPFYLLLAIGWLAAGYPLFGNEATQWRIVSPAKVEKTLPSLPALAVVGPRDDSGETWVLQGSISGTRQIAARDFHTCFEQQGWQFDKVIPIGAGGRNGSLFLWRREGRSIFLMLHESGVAQTDFALNLEDKPRRISTDKNLKP